MVLDDFTEDDLGNLDIGKLIDLTGGPINGYKEFLNNNELTKKDLLVLFEAESSGRNRPSVKSFLSRQISRKEVKDFLEIAESDIDELENVIGELKNIEDVGDVSSVEGDNLDQDELVSLIGGTVSELKDFVNSNKLSSEDLINLLESEKKVKDRKTAKEYLRKEIDKRNIADDVSSVEEDLENLKKDLGQLEEDEMSLESDVGGESERAEEMIESLEDGLELLEGLPEEDKTKVDEGTEEDKADEEEVEEDNDNNSETEDNVDNDAGDHKDSDKQEEKEDTDENEEETSDEESDDEERSDEDNRKEEKLEVIEDLDVDIPEETLLEMSLRDLKSIKDEKDYRSQLISSLKQFDMEEEHLKNSSTKDLERLYENMRDKHGDEFSDFVKADQEADKSSKEIREEAEEDLEMLMGASKNPSEAESEDGKDSPTDKINDLADSIEDKIMELRGKDSGEDEEVSGTDSKNVSRMLEEYQEIDNEREAAVKTAHVMKGYLEFKLGIDHELTYKELAEALPDDKKHMEELKRFFQKMHREEYLKNVKIHDINNTIDICQEVVSEF